MIESRKIKVFDLLLWDENSRLPDKLSGQDQAAIRKALLDDVEKRYEIRALAKEIVKDFDLPPLEKLVVIAEDGNFIVYEGNRRIVAYQCLIDPALAGNHQSEFDKLAAQANIPKDVELECLITQDFTQANRYIERKHLNNNNEKAWGQLERDNHSARVKRFGGNADKNRIKRANIGKLVWETNLPDQMKKKVLGPGYVTNFYRIVDSTPGYSYFGFTVNDEGELEYKDKDDLLAKLKVFIFKLLTSNPESGQSWSRAYNSNEEKKEYLKTLDPSLISKVDTEIEASKTTNLLGEEEIKINDSKGKPLFTSAKEKANNTTNPLGNAAIKINDSKGKPLFTSAKEKEYPTLLKPSNKRLLVGEESKKIDEIYRELQHIVVEDCPHAVSVLLRILTEITVKRFLIVNGEKFTNEGGLIAKEGKPRTELKQKIAYIADNYASGDMRTAMLALNEELFTQSLNQVVHNIGYFATEKQVRDFWKTLRGIFEFLVQGIIEKENDANKNS